MKSNKINNISISQTPYSFDTVFKGRCNGEDFYLNHTGDWNAHTEEVETSVTITWRSAEEPKDAKFLEEGIKKIYKKRLDG